MTDEETFKCINCLEIFRNLFYGEKGFCIFCLNREYLKQYRFYAEILDALAKDKGQTLGEFIKETQSKTQNQKQY